LSYGERSEGQGEEGGGEHGDECIRVIGRSDVWNVRCRVGKLFVVIYVDVVTLPQ